MHPAVDPRPSRIAEQRAKPQRADLSAGGITIRTRVLCFATALGLAAALGFAIPPTAGKAPVSQASRTLVPAPAQTIALNPARLILNALLVPALDVDAMPLRWVDPRPLLTCGPGTIVRIDGKPLRAGARVPDVPFEMEWQAHGCRPFGLHGPQFDGRVRLTIFREDWGFSAVVQPSRLQVAWAEQEAMLVLRGAAWMPQCDDVEASPEPYQATIGTDRSLRC